ncbi:endoplasmic reticulum membrane sensor NFE2L1-like [Odontesthes bonariensis]
MAILLSLCGGRLDVELESFLRRSWHERIRCPMSGLIQAQFQNLCSRLMGHSLHPKSVELERFIIIRRLLRWLRSLDRLQAPHVELETWRVQQELNPLPVEYPEPHIFLEVQRDQTVPPVLLQAGLSNLQEEEQKEFSDVEGRGLDSSEAVPPQSSLVGPDESSMDLDLELHWQDLLAILEPECTDMEMMTSFHHAVDSRPYEPALLALTPSTELDDHSAALCTRATYNMDSLHAPTDYTGLLAEDVPENAEDHWTTFNMTLLTQDVMHRMEPESVGVNHSCDLTASSLTPTLEGNRMTQKLLEPVYSASLLNEEDVYALCSPLTDLLEDSTVLDGIGLPDLALEEGFSPGMVARIQEDPVHEVAQQETGRNDNLTGAQDQAGAEDETDSDSGLSLDWSYSPASSSVLQGSTPSTSSSSRASAVRSPFSDDEDKDAEENSAGWDVEVEVIKQEELQEEMGADEGFTGDVEKLFPLNFGVHKLFHDFSWLEHIGHDHTYNKPSSSTSPQSLGKMHPNRSKTALRFDNTKTYHCPSPSHISLTKIWSRYEQRAQSLRLPFSNELIINLPARKFNDLLSNHRLTEEQLALVRDMRRRGKNKIAAQNCRRRKQDVLLRLEEHVSALRNQRAQLLREKRGALRHLQEVKCRLGMLYRETFSKLSDEEAESLKTIKSGLHFGSSDPVASVTMDKSSKKQRDKIFIME